MQQNNPYNPYEILEISRSATDDEIKRAYRELAKKYHPDNFKDNPLSDLATEKMKAINEAYEMIQKERGNGNGAAGHHHYQGYQGAGPRPGGSNFTGFSRVRELVQARRFSEAEIMLDSVGNSGRNAEWFYLKGVLLTERGWFFDAQKNFEAAHQLDPGNHEYSDALHQIRNKSNQYYEAGGYNTARQNSSNGCGCSVCDICMGLMCLDCLCGSGCC